MESRTLEETMANLNNSIEVFRKSMKTKKKAEHDIQLSVAEIIQHITFCELATQKIVKKPLSEKSTKALGDIYNFLNASIIAITTLKLYANDMDLPELEGSDVSFGDALLSKAKSIQQTAASALIEEGLLPDNSESSSDLSSDLSSGEEESFDHEPPQPAASPQKRKFDEAIVTSCTQSMYPAIKKPRTEPAQKVQESSRVLRSHEKRPGA